MFCYREMKWLILGYETLVISPSVVVGAAQQLTCHYTLVALPVFLLPCLPCPVLSVIISPLTRCGVALPSLAHEGNPTQSSLRNQFPGRTGDGHTSTEIKQFFGCKTNSASISEKVDTLYGVKQCILLSTCHHRAQSYFCLRSLLCLNCFLKELSCV